MINISIKVGLFGDSNVGKSTIINILDNRTNINIGVTTIGVDFIFKNYIKNDTSIKLQIWDTAGQERYKSIIEKYYNVHIPIFIFDISNKTSFENIINWIELYNKHSKIEPIKKYLIGNKTDLNSNFNHEKLNNIVTKYNLTYYTNTSLIKNNTSSVNNIFNKIVDYIYISYLNDHLEHNCISIYNNNKNKIKLKDNLLLNNNLQESFLIKNKYKYKYKCCS